LCEAHAVHDHTRTRSHSAYRTALDTVQDGRVDSAAGGRRAGMRPVSLRITRRAELGRVVAELTGAGAHGVHVRAGKRVCADELAVAGERSAQVRDIAAISELATVRTAGRGWKTTIRKRRMLGPDAGVDNANDDT